MITTVITALPEAGHRGIDLRDDFVLKQETFQDALTGIDPADGFVDEINDVSGEINTVASDIDTKHGTVVAKEALMNPHYDAIDAVSANETNVNIVATDIANINLVGAGIDDVTTLADDLNEAVSEIETVAANIDGTNTIETVGLDLQGTDTIGTVATDIANVNTTATDITNVNTTAGSIANVNIVATDIANVNATGADIANVNTTAGSIANVNIVAPDIANVNTVATDIANVNIVAPDIANVNTTAGSIASVNTVAGDLSGSDTIGTVATDIANVNATGSDIANVNTTATNIADVNTVAGDLSGTDTIGTVATDIANVNAAGADIANVNTTATNIDDVNTVADNIVDIQNAEANALIAQSAANYKGDWEADYEVTGYSQADSVTYTDDKNYVSKVDTNLVEPTTGTETDEWNFLDSVTNTQLDLKADKSNVLERNNTDVYSPSSDYEPATKAYVDAVALTGGGNVEITTVTRFVATQGQTTFTVDYIVGSLNVTLKGIELDSTDYTAGNGTSVEITGITVNVDDIVRVTSYGGADVYNKTQADALLNAKANLSGPTFTGIPAAPTASGGTNTTQVATTAFVQAFDDSAKANLSGATFTGGVLFNDTASGKVTATSSTVSCSTGNYFTDSITSNITYTFSSPPSGFYVMTMRLYDGGDYTVTFPSSVKWADDTPPELASNSYDVLTFYTDNSGSTWYGMLSIGNAV